MSTAIPVESVPPWPTRPADRRDRWAAADVLAAAVLAAVTFALYARGRHFPFIRYDDPYYIANDRHVMAGLTWAGLKYAVTRVVLANYHPLTTLAEMAVVQAFGPGPAAFHLANAALHAANVALLYAFFRLATGLRWRAVCVAALWGWHPLRVESVAWVSEIKDELCGLFWLGTMLAFWWYRRRPSPGGYAAVVACLAAALLAKSMAVTLPAVLVLLDWWPLGPTAASPAAPGVVGRARVPLGRRLLEYAPLFLLSAAVVALTLVTQSRGQATGSLQRFPMPARVTNALAGYLAYVDKSVAPTSLALFHPHPAMFGRPTPVAQWVGGGVLLLAGSGWAVWVRRSRPYVFVGWFWFVGTLVPVIGLIQVGEQSWADRYSYLTAIGLTVAVVWTAADAVVDRPRCRPALAAAGVAAAGALLVGTTVQLDYWRDDATLFAHADRVVPGNYVARGNRALDAADAGDLPAALALARSAVAVLPTNMAVHQVLAYVLELDGQLKAAFAEYEIAIPLAPRNPQLRTDFGDLLVKQHRDADAVQQFERAIKLDPQTPEPRQSLGVLLLRQRRYAEAIDQFRTVLNLDPESVPAAVHLGDALRLSGDPSGAVDAYKAAVALGDTTSDTKVQLAWLSGIDARTTAQDLTPLVPLAKEACDQTGNREPFPLYAYSLVLARVNRYDDAIATATLALDRARAAHDTTLAANIERRLAAYRQGLPGAVVANPTSGPTTRAS